MLKIRLAKRGRKKAPTYRVVVSNSTSPRDGRHIEIIGFYNPSNNPVLFEIDKEKYKQWISKGAQPTEAVTKLIEGKYDFKPYNKETRAKEAEEAANAESENEQEQNTTEVNNGEMPTEESEKTEPKTDPKENTAEEKNKTE